MKLLVLDNYDSFTHNLVYLIKEAGFVPDIFRNDKITVSEALRYDAILISPGPGIPKEAGITKELIASFPLEKPLFGVCLGHQALAEVYGAVLFNLSTVFHGVAKPVEFVTPDPIFDGLESGFLAGRYHSWAVKPNSVKAPLQILANDQDGNVMALRYGNYPRYGVQFHPESILTINGNQLLYNWLKLIPGTL